MLECANIDKYGPQGYAAGLWRRCLGNSGHDFAAIEWVVQGFGLIKDRPEALSADTIKGRGVLFMEGPAALKDGQGLYRWHAGAPDDDSCEAGYGEILQRVNGRLADPRLAPLVTEVLETRERHRMRLKDTAGKVVNAFGEAVVELGAWGKDVVVFGAAPEALACILRHIVPRKREVTAG
jgi:transketolase